MSPPVSVLVGDNGCANLAIDFADDEIRSCDRRAIVVWFDVFLLAMRQEQKPIAWNWYRLEVVGRGAVGGENHVAWRLQSREQRSQPAAESRSRQVGKEGQHEDDVELIGGREFLGDLIRGQRVDTKLILEEDKCFVMDVTASQGQPGVRLQVSGNHAIPGGELQEADSV